MGIIFSERREKTDTSFDDLTGLFKLQTKKICLNLFIWFYLIIGFCWIAFLISSLISHENVTRHARLHFVLFAFPYRPFSTYLLPEIDKFNMTRVLFLKVLRRMRRAYRIASGNCVTWRKQILIVTLTYNQNIHAQFRYPSNFIYLWNLYFNYSFFSILSSSVIFKNLMKNA